ncbi:putative reverse transcriptase domain, reverse transcriptase zinc-binding domain protein [Tanacetum coccineum]
MKVFIAKEKANEKVWGLYKALCTVDEFMFGVESKKKSNITLKIDVDKSGDTSSLKDISRGFMCVKWALKEGFRVILKNAAQIKVKWNRGELYQANSPRREQVIVNMRDRAKEKRRKNAPKLVDALVKGGKLSKEGKSVTCTNQVSQPANVTSHPASGVSEPTSANSQPAKATSHLANATSHYASGSQLVKNRVSRTRIDVILDTSGNQNDDELVYSAFVSHYIHFLGQPGTTNCLNTQGLFKSSLTSVQAEYMVRNVIEDEVMTAIFCMGDDKSPGPDGYTTAFFKGVWDIVGHDVINAVREFFANRKLFKEVNHTIISLIPKAFSPTSINDYRPISCCNVIFKCINYAQLSFGYHLDRGPPRCAFKVDIQKAYDTVDWDFLRTVLMGFGFHSTMISWIMECLTTTYFSLSVNGSLHGYFKGRRGLRQEEFTYHHNCSNMNISNLCFAGDLFLFAHGDVNSARIIMEALDEFKRWCANCPLINEVSIRVIYGAGLTTSSKVAGAMNNGSWLWPSDWADKYPTTFDTIVPSINMSSQDTLWWRDNQGNFKAFSVGIVWEDIRPRGIEAAWTNVIWYPHCIPRHAFHLWLVMQRKLKTQDRLKQWDVGDNTNLNLL